MGAQGLFGKLLGAVGGGDLGEEAQELLSKFQSGDASDEEAEQHYDQVQDHPEAQAAQQDVLNNMDADHFQDGAQQAASSLPPHQRTDLASDLMDALEGRGLDLQSIASELGLSSTSAASLAPEELGKLLGWAQQNQPDALNEAVGDKPWFVKAMGNDVVCNIVSNLAGRILNR